MKKIFESIKKTFDKSTKKAGELIPHRDFGVDIICNHIVPKTAKHLEGSLQIQAHTELNIKKIAYEIIEIVDPIIGKNKNEAEILGTLENKKTTSLSDNQKHEFDFKIPIHFANEHRKESTGGDMKLLNQMSERSKKTAINYDLKILITYTLPGEVDPQTRKVKFDISFE